LPCNKLIDKKIKNRF